MTVVSYTITVDVTDATSGVAGVTYSLDGGAPQGMTYDLTSHTWVATFGSNLSVSTYNVTITATDLAGNTANATDVLAVYDPSNGYVTGHAKTLPTASDTLPIALDTSSQTTQLVIGFTNATAPASGSFDIDYKFKNNKDEFSLSSTAINWVVVSDSTHASILGHATMTTYAGGVMSVTQNMAVRFDITLASNSTPGSVSIKIYNSGVDPAPGTPAYVVNDVVNANGSNLMIHP